MQTNKEKKYTKKPINKNKKPKKPNPKTTSIEFTTVI